MRGAAAWIAGLTARERVLVTAAVTLTTVIACGTSLRALRDDFAARRARVTSHERELGEVRRLAVMLGHDGVPAVPEPATGVSLLARLEGVADAVVGRERIASMTPVSAAAEDGLVEERVTLRVTSASLPETVRLLHALESEAGLGVTRLDLRKHVDDPGRFDATYEVARLRSPS
jgi:hypothetical protein